MKHFDKYKEIFTTFLGERSKKLRRASFGISICVFLGYLSASTLGSLVIGILGDGTLKGSGARSSSRDSIQGISKNLNYRTLKKSVAERNIFNSDGKFPDESSASIENAVETTFNPKAPCNDSTLRHELVGTIFMGKNSPNSLAAIREKGYNIADIYKVGDQIIGNLHASVFAVNQSSVELNNNGVKECLELKKYKKRGSSLPKIPTPKPNSDEDDTDAEVSEGNSRVSLGYKFVTDALGEGYAKILESGRLVPYMSDNQLIGYKLIGVKPGTLYKKIGLGSGDVLTSVNGISMSQPEQGFAFYNALAEEKEIRIEVLKGGKNPTTITVEIR